jgi:adenine-specific DNA glycosylase
VLLEQRPRDGLWGGLWQAPAVEASVPLQTPAVRKALPLRVRDLRRCGSFEFATTHRRVTFHVFTARAVVGRAARGSAWVGSRGLVAVPMSSAHRRVLAAAKDGGG